MLLTDKKKKQAKYTMSGARLRLEMLWSVLAPILTGNKIQLWKRFCLFSGDDIESLTWLVRSPTRDLRTAHSKHCSLWMSIPYWTRDSLIWSIHHLRNKNNTTAPNVEASYPWKTFQYYFSPLTNQHSKGQSFDAFFLVSWISVIWLYHPLKHSHARIWRQAVSKYLQICKRQVKT